MFTPIKLTYEELATQIEKSFFENMDAIDWQNKLDEIFINAGWTRDEWFDEIFLRLHG